MESFIFTVRRRDVEALNEAMETWGLNHNPHVTLAFDSVTPPEWVQVVVNGITSPAAMNCLSAAIGYFLARNKGKKIEVHNKDGEKIIVEGHSHSETSQLLDKAMTHLKIDDKKPT